MYRPASEEEQKKPRTGKVWHKAFWDGGPGDKKKDGNDGGSPSGGASGDGQGVGGSSAGPVAASV